MDIEWVIGPQITEVLDFLVDGYFYLHNTISNELFIVRMFNNELKFFDEAAAAHWGQFTSSHYRWAKVPYPVGINIPKNFQSTQGR